MPDKPDSPFGSLIHYTGLPVIAGSHKISHKDLCPHCTTPRMDVASDHRSVSLHPRNGAGRVEVNWTQPGDAVGIHVKPYITQHNGHCVSQTVAIPARELHDAVLLVLLGVPDCPTVMEQKRERMSIQRSANDGKAWVPR